jgi:hypothetical protein
MSILDLSKEELAGLVHQISGERERAINERNKSKLPSIWSKARKQYRGEDILNDPLGSGMEKGETLDSSVTRRVGQTKDVPGSKVVVNITRPYTNAGTARVADILLPTNKLPFKLKQTPVSDLETLRNAVNENPTLAALLPQLSPALHQKLTAEEDVTKAATEQAFNLIADWLKECNWGGCTRKQISEAGQVGTGVIKGPFPKQRKLRKDIRALLQVLPAALAENGVGEALAKELSTILEFTPHVECIKVENCFPDGDCGSDIQQGRFFFELVPEVTRRQIRDYKEDATYDREALDKVLEQVPTSALERKLTKNSPYELWIRTGYLELSSDDDNSSSSPAPFGFQVTTLINDIIVRSEKFWLDNEIFPYWILCWESRENSWAGIGIPEQIETPQRGTTASTRALMDNMGFSVGPQVLEMEGLIEPVDGSWIMYAYKRWTVKSQLPGVDAMKEAKEALSFLEFPNYLQELMPVIQFWLKMAEDTTGLSLLLQGQAVTDAVGVSQQLMNNATTNLRLIVKGWDDDVCHPMMTAFYDWVQLYGPEVAKGDAVVEPLGSATLIVRELQQQALLQIGDRVLQPIFGISPKKWMQMYLEGFQVDFDVLALTEEERAELQKAAEEDDVKVQVAKIEAHADVQVQMLKQEMEKIKLAVEALFKSIEEAGKAANDDFTQRLEVFRAALEDEEAEASIPERVAKAQKAMAELGKKPATRPTSAPVDVDAEPVDVDSALESLGLGA